MAASVAVGMKQNLPGGNSAVVPPDPMPNSEVKRRSADGSVGSPHARVGHCQASNKTKALRASVGLLFYCCVVCWSSMVMRPIRRERMGTPLAAARQG
jgi:hypothetical protein